jgi:uncharacterized protein YbjT (DUF2867 family)
MTQGKILITGATGTVGSHIVEQLSRSKVNFRAAYHDAAKASKMNLPGVEMVQLDNDKPETISTSLSGVEKLFLLTPAMLDIVEITSNFVDEAKKAGVKQIVKLSVMGADTEPRTIGGRLHREAERVIENSGISYTHLRPNYFMQNFVNFYGETIKDQNAFYLPLADAKVSFVDVRNIASVAIEALTSEGHEGKAYTITGPEALTCQEVAQILSDATGKAITYANISDEEARQGMVKVGMPADVVDYLIDLYRFTREGYFSLITTVVEQVTGKKPITFRQFAAEHKETLKK